MSFHSVNPPFYGASHHLGFFSRILAALSLHKQRRDLARLDDHALRDIGITRHEAEAEAARPIWDVPGHWTT